MRPIIFTLIFIFTVGCFQDLKIEPKNLEVAQAPTKDVESSNVVEQKENTEIPILNKDNKKEIKQDEKIPNIEEPQGKVGQKPERENLSLTIMLPAQRKIHGVWHSVDLLPNRKIKKRDQTKIFFSSNQDCYLYIYWKSSEGISPIFPISHYIETEPYIENNITYSIPPDPKKWIEIAGNPGEEMIIILAFKKIPSEEVLENQKKLLENTNEENLQNITKSLPSKGEQLAFIDVDARDKRARGGGKVVKERDIDIPIDHPLKKTHSAIQLESKENIINYGIYINHLPK